MGKIQHVLTAECPGLGERCGQADRRAEIVPESRELSTRVLKRQIGIQNARTDIADCRVVVKVLRQLLQASWQHDNIGIN